MFDCIFEMVIGSIGEIVCDFAVESFSSGVLKTLKRATRAFFPA